MNGTPILFLESDSFLLKWILWTLLTAISFFPFLPVYIISCYLLLTMKRDSPKDRKIIWTASLVFLLFFLWGEISDKSERDRQCGGRISANRVSHVCFSQRSVRWVMQTRVVLQPLNNNCWCQSGKRFSVMQDRARCGGLIIVFIMDFMKSKATEVGEEANTWQERTKS